jgi:hypothetical protein
MGATQRLLEKPSIDVKMTDTMNIVYNQTGFQLHNLPLLIRCDTGSGNTVIILSRVWSGTGRGLEFSYLHETVPIPAVHKGFTHILKLVYFSIYLLEFLEIFFIVLVFGLSLS